jgi:hypothetical protein
MFRPAGPDQFSWDFLGPDPSAPETQERSTCSARSAAMTNDVDSNEHRRTLARTRKGRTTCRTRYGGPNGLRRA